MPTTSAKLISADELLKMGDIGRCELIYGELVTISPAGLEHGEVALRIGRLLQEFVDAKGLGAVFAAETGFKVETNPDLVRAPDASFIRKARLPDRRPKGFFDGAPDLAVEVISPGESRREVAAQVAQHAPQAGPLNEFEIASKRNSHNTPRKRGR
jgi:Uma2 family endonuclease